MAVTFLAEPLVSIVGGAKYLHVPETIKLFGYQWHYWGGSNLTLRLVIWSIPIGFVNSVTQYVLIAVNQQHYLTRAFIIGVIFNIVGNFLLIPGTGYVGASVVTILSELSLLFPFYYSVKRNVGVVPWFLIIVPPLISTLVMASVIYALTVVGVNVWLAVSRGVYGLCYHAAAHRCAAWRRYGHRGSCVADWAFAPVVPGIDIDRIRVTQMASDEPNIHRTPNPLCRTA